MNCTSSTESVQESPQQSPAFQLAPTPSGYATMTFRVVGRAIHAREDDLLGRVRREAVKIEDELGGFRFVVAGGTWSHASRGRLPLVSVMTGSPEPALSCPCTMPLSCRCAPPSPKSVPGRVPPSGSGSLVGYASARSTSPSKLASTASPFQ